MKLFEEKYGTLEYDSTVPCITATFNGFMSSEQFRTFLNKGLDHLIEKKPSNGKILWLADTRKHVVQPDKDTQWVADEWNPRALKGGIHHVAFVLPENVFGNASVKRYADNTTKKKAEMDVQMFGDINAAKQWFMNLK
ncbi:STAS/SEC14 domain-containing protein [Chryseolinea sp. H1M3-3]|uniref:STAS/SEC14 domain-containing protein n=1 Tax=Chryseolinea sp. H1M3-3 TaxID=3034144 RepID=UPI0023EC0CC8|nr:STAS/SEC14 domain-containing protein [Chryseolinea sp. H1M3-3]